MLSTICNKRRRGKQIRIIPTDMISPEPLTDAGLALHANLQALRQVDQLCFFPTQQVDIMQIETWPLIDGGADLYVTGSPAPHDPQYNRFQRYEGTPEHRFKTQCFYYLAWHTPPDSIVMMTWCGRVSQRTAMWAPDRPGDGRYIATLKAHFDTYRPTRGGETKELLGHENGDDIKLAIYATHEQMSKLVFRRDGRCDVASTITRWKDQSPGNPFTVMTFSAYDLELERDMMMHG